MTAGMHIGAIKQSQRYFIAFVTITGIFVIINLKNFNLPTRSSTGTRDFFNNETTVREHPNQSNNFLRHLLKVQNSDLTDEDLLKYSENALPNFPISFWNENKDRNLYYKNNSCARFPTLYLMKMSNLYWQTLIAKNRTIYLLSAYYDNREGNPGGPCVRLVGMIEYYIEPPTYCHIWFANRTEPAIVKTVDNAFRKTDVRKGDKRLYFPFLPACVIPKEFADQVPSVVSLVEEMCDTASNAVRVIYEKPSEAGKKDRFGVCVRTLDFFHSDKSVRLVEWIELVKLLGAEKIHMYTAHVHENITKVLRYYEKKGVIDITPMTLAGSQVNVAGFQHLYNYYGPNFLTEMENELVSINDCVLKNMHKYEYIAIIDIDEIIMPLKVNNWLDLMKKVRSEALAQNKTAIGGYYADMIHFPTTCDSTTRWHDDIPYYMFMLQHVLRNVTRPRWYCPKTFMNTNLVRAVSNHWAQTCLPSEVCQWYEISDEEALTLQYHTALEDKGKSCEQMRPILVTDTTLWRFKEPLVNRSLQVLEDLEFF